MSGVDNQEPSERTVVVFRRYEEARRYGFTRREARLFAESDVDVGELRRLKRAKCPPDRAAAILL